MNPPILDYDITFYCIILLSALWALFKGAVNEVLSLAVWLLAFWFMRNFGNPISSHLASGINNPLLRNVIAFILFFIVFAIIGTLLKKACNIIIRNLGLSGLNYVLGLIFGILRGIFICSILIIILITFKLDSSYAWEKTRVYPILHPIIKWIISAIPKQI